MCWASSKRSSIRSATRTRRTVSPFVPAKAGTQDQARKRFHVWAPASAGANGGWASAHVMAAPFVPLSSRRVPRYARRNTNAGSVAMSARTKPPFRADHVGSILRSAAIHSARTKAAKGEIAAAELKAVEDREIDSIIKKQEEIGLQLATDGEYRRSWWHLDFCWGLTGCEKITLPHGIKFHGVETRPEGYRITGKLDFPSDHPMLEHFRFLKAHTKAVPKMCIPAPPVLHFRLPKDGIPKSVYANMDTFFADLGQTYAKAVKAFYDAGCRYLQFDDTVWAYLCSPSEMQAARERMPMADNLPQIYQDVINTAL